ncbi:MAG: right-handed parallel beta-helix repeat-containing protein [Nitrospirae bacterium]|nr:right-handed parallel beta-helix repeat-containing protein [Nitrospirota bacterium]
MFRRVSTALICGVLLISWAHELKAATIYVSDDFKTIQDAVDNSHAGDSIVVREGEYHGNIVITKPLILKSERGPEKTIVHAADSSEPVFRISDVKDVVISGFTSTDSSVAGIYLNNSVNIEISDNKAVNNRNGIALISSNSNKLTNNKSNLNKLSGIYLESSNNNELERNETNSNREKGIFLNSSNNNNIVSNVSNRNEWNGITLWVSNNNRVEKNEVMRNTYSIIVSGSMGNILNDNYTWTNLYIILPILLLYTGVVLFFIQRKIYSLIYSG